MLEALRFLRGRIATTRGRGSLRGLRGGRRLGDDGGRPLGHIYGCAVRAPVCGATARRRKKRSETDENAR